MIEKTFKHYNELFSPMIKKLIDSNVKFYGFKETVRWCFVENKDISIFATCGNDNIIYVNLLAVIDSYSIGDIRQIEYFLLHEIRHIFQNIMINDFKSGKMTAVDSELIKIWIIEKEKYQLAVDDSGNENLDYFKQDIVLNAMDEYISKKAEEGIKISYMDIIYATVVRIIAERPSLNRFAMNR